MNIGVKQISYNAQAQYNTMETITLMIREDLCFYGNYVT